MTSVAKIKGGKMRKEKEHPEKKEEGMEEKWHRDPFSAIFTGLIIAMIGLFLFLAAQGYIGWGKWWAYFLLGLGGIFIIEVIVRSVIPEYRKPIFGKLVAGVVLICIGAGNIYGLREWWPLIIIVVGVAILILGLRRVRRPD